MRKLYLIGLLYLSVVALVVQRSDVVESPLGLQIGMHEGPDALTVYARSEESDGWVTLIPSTGAALVRALEALDGSSGSASE